MYIYIYVHIQGLLVLRLPQFQSVTIKHRAAALPTSESPAPAGVPAHVGMARELGVVSFLKENT